MEIQGYVTVEDFVKITKTKNKRTVYRQMAKDELPYITISGVRLIHLSPPDPLKNLKYENYLHSIMEQLASEDYKLRSLNRLFGERAKTMEELLHSPK